jgi:hypothetical protein
MFFRPIFKNQKKKSLFDECQNFFFSSKRDEKHIKMIKECDERRGAAVGK